MLEKRALEAFMCACKCMHHEKLYDYVVSALKQLFVYNKNLTQKFKSRHDERRE